MKRNVLTIWKRVACRWGWILGLWLLFSGGQAYQAQVAWAQRIVNEGLGEEHRDTLRRDYREPGKEDKDTGNQIGDQRIGWEEKSVSKELKEKELLRKQEDLAHLKRMQEQRAAAEEAEQQARREQERIKEKQQLQNMRTVTQ